MKKCKLCLFLCLILLGFSSINAESPETKAKYDPYLGIYLLANNMFSSVYAYSFMMGLGTGAMYNSSAFNAGVFAGTYMMAFGQAFWAEARVGINVFEYYTTDDKAMLISGISGGGIEINMIKRTVANRLFRVSLYGGVELNPAYMNLYADLEMINKYIYDDRSDTMGLFGFLPTINMCDIKLGSRFLINVSNGGNTFTPAVEAYLRYWAIRLSYDYFFNGQGMFNFGIEGQFDITLKDDNNIDNEEEAIKIDNAAEERPAGVFEELMKAGEAELYGKQALDGIKTVYYESGRAKAKRTLKAGILNGPVIYYYKNGNKKAWGTYKNGKPDGSAKLYYSDGILSEQETYRNGVLVRQIKYGKDGGVKFDTEY